MDNEALHIRYLIGVAAILCAVIIGYNLFFTQEPAVSTIVYTDSSLINSSQSAKTEEYATEKVQSSSTSSKYTSIQSKKININTATIKELCDLPGIGPVMAQKILDYREQNGKFKTTDELKNVSGIGEKTFQKFSNLITIE